VRIILLMILMLSILQLTAETKQVEVMIKGDTLTAKIDIPENMHLAKQEDFVYVEADSLAGLKLGDTIWPEGGHKDDLGIINYENEIILKRSLKISDDLRTTGFTLKIYVGYQMCYDSYCELPEELEFEVKYKCNKPEIENN